jgi:hypothetical protein
LRLGKRRWATLVGATCALSPGRAHSQSTGTVDFGVSAVRYDGFLLSSATSLTPAFQWEGHDGQLSARGTYLRFQSGHRTLQGGVRGSLFTRAAWRWRGEFSVGAGASSYAAFATFWSTVAEARLHVLDGNRGAWIGAAGGETSFGSSPRPVAGPMIGVWARQRGLTLTVSAGRVFVGDTVYSDLESTARIQRGALELEGTIGARVWSRGGGHGVYSEGSAVLGLGRRAAIVISGGRNPTDPTSGTVAARYVTVAVRLQTAAMRRRASRDPPVFIPGASWNSKSAAGAARLEVRQGPQNALRLIVRAPAASAVEIIADFTDWQPVRLYRGASGAWEVVLEIPHGMHRVEVRLDGAGWIVPTGTTRVEDDFGGEVGLFAVP